MIGWPAAYRTGSIPSAIRSRAASGSGANSGIPRSSRAWRSGRTPSSSRRRTHGQPRTAVIGSTIPVTTSARSTPIVVTSTDPISAPDRDPDAGHHLEHREHRAAGRVRHAALEERQPRDVEQRVADAGDAQREQRERRAGRDADEHERRAPGDERCREHAREPAAACPSRRRTAPRRSRRRRWPRRGCRRPASPMPRTSIARIAMNVVSAPRTMTWTPNESMRTRGRRSVDELADPGQQRQALAARRWRGPGGRGDRDPGDDRGRDDAAGRGDRGGRRRAGRGDDDAR